jgi:nucleoside-diphosphate-sugar epimerase
VILVTGATGFLGRHVVDALLAAGRPVRALVRQRSRSLGALGVEQVVGDVADPAALAGACAGAERVFHLAGLVSRDRRDATGMMRVHVDGTRNLLGAARAAGAARVVVASSSGTIAVSDSPDMVATEDSPFALELVKGWPYYLSKIYQEQVALAHSAPPEVVILNPSLLLGPGDRRGSSTEDVQLFLARRIPVLPEGGINFVDVRDAAAAFVAAMDRGRAGERYLLGGPNWTLATFFGRLERLAKVPGPRLRVPASWARTGASVLERLAEWRGTQAPVGRTSVEMSQCFWYLDASKARRELGFDPRDPQETLLDTIKWIREHFPGAERGTRRPESG